MTALFSDYPDTKEMEMSGRHDYDVTTSCPHTYTPHPVDTSDVTLPVELLPLREQIAAHVHDLWSKQRIADGWTYGAERDDVAMTNPCLVPYDELPDGEKAYDRDTAEGTVSLLVKLGWTLTPPVEEARDDDD